MRAFAVDVRQRLAAVIQTDAPILTTPSDVELRMLEVGICGTDREIARFEYGTPPPGEDRLVIGHESLAEVLEVGPEVADLTPGDLVVPSVRRPCASPNCSACRGGRQDFCYTGEFTERGIKEASGYLAERVVEDARYLTRVPAELREVAVLVEPLTIAEKAIAQVWQVQQRLPWACGVAQDSRPAQGCSALVLGAGPVGLLGAMALAESGFHTFVYSREPEGGARSKLVESFGGRYVSAQTTTIDELPPLLGGVDIVYEATGASGLAFDVLRVLGENGVYIFTGVPGRKHPFEIEAGTIMKNLVLKNQVLFGTVNAGAESFAAAIARLGRFMKKWPDVVRGLITRRWPLEETGRLLADPGPGVKHVVSLESM